jgi:diketogulonate reductase-like aldo/keto reductase
MSATRSPSRLHSHPALISRLQTAGPVEAIDVERALILDRVARDGRSPPRRTKTTHCVAPLAQKPFVVPIPGTSHVGHLEENAAAAALSLSVDTAEVLARVFAPGAAAGLRYPQSHLARLGI